MSSTEDFLPIYLRLPTEAQKLLADSDIDLVATLREEGFDVCRSAAPDPTREPSGEKDAAQVILAFGTAAPLIAIAIAKVLDSLGRNQKYVASRRVLKPAVDKDGEQVRNASGKPIMYWSDEKYLVEAIQTVQDKTSASLKVPQLLEFEIKNG